MFCNKCGKEVEDGNKFCNSCGAPVQASAGFANNTVVNHFGNASALNRGNQTTWVIVAMIISALMVITLIMSGVGMKISEDGITMKIGLPIGTVSSIVSQVIKISSVEDPWSMRYLSGISDANFWLGVCRVLMFVSITLVLVSGFMTMKKSSAGVISGLLSNVFAILFAIVAIITLFGVNSDVAYLAGSSPRISIYPTACVWFTLILGVINGLLMLVKGKAMISE